MIKKIVLALIAIFVLISCESSQNYSVQLENQRKQIREYIERNGISLIETYPADSVFKSNEYLWMGQDSIIFRLAKKGVGDAVKPGDHITVRWVQYSIDGNGDSVSYWTTGDVDYPLELVFDPDPNSATNLRRSNTNSIGWQSAIRLMQRSDAIAEFIVPSPIGTLTAFNNVKAYRYKLTFKIQPK